MSAVGPNMRSQASPADAAPPPAQKQGWMDGLRKIFSCLSTNDKVENAAKPVLQKDPEPSMLPKPVSIMDSYIERVESETVMPALLEFFSTNKDKEEGQIILQAITNFVDGKAKAITLPAEKQGVGAKVFLLDELNAILRRASKDQIHTCISFLCKHCPNLRALDFSQTKVGKETIQLLPGFPCLERLAFCGNDIISKDSDHVEGSLALVDADFESLLRCTRLLIVDLSRFATNGDVFKMLPAGLHCLRAHSYPNIAEDKLALLGRFTQLRVLDLEGWYGLIDYSDKAFDFLLKLTELEELILDRNGTIKDAHFKAVAHLTKLRKLSVKSFRNVITDAAFEAISHMPELIELDASKLNITGAGFIHLAKCKKLEILRCSYCQELTDVALTHIKPCTTLKVLDLSHCGQVTSVGFSSLQYLTELTWLSLDWTQAKNDDLQFVVPLKKLTFLDVSHSNAGITTEAFRYLFSLKQLEVLKAVQTGIRKMIPQQDPNKRVETFSSIKPYMPRLLELETSPF